MSNYDAYVKNTIIWNNVPGQGYLYSWGEDKGLWLSWSDIMGGKNSIVCSDTLSLHWLEGNIDADPVFINSGDFPYAISFNSPCLDAGILDTTGLNLPVKDITGNPRVWNGRIDMGAMEWNSLGYEELRVSGSGLRVICYPNPTDGKINLQFTIYSLQSVTVVIYDLNGREVTTVLDEKLPAGEHTIRWDAGNLPAGMYFYRLTTDDCHLPTATGKILLH